MARRHDEPTEVAEESPEPRLDPETRARRDAALRLVRKHGDPVLRSRALPVERFDESLREEVRRMGEVMNDALGIGLAATQVGVMHRVLVYRVEAEAAIAALVNPVLEWSSEEREPMEEGCLSLPGVLVEVERPVHVLVRAQDERGEAIVIEASGLEGCLPLGQARVLVEVERPTEVTVEAQNLKGEPMTIEAEGMRARILQHEIDHLDGVLILDRTSREQRKAAMRALREAEQAASVR